MMTDKFLFYSKSADKYPGKGNKEYVINDYKYKELSEYKDWRKMLSNFYVSPFILDNEEWNSLEHWYHASKFRNDKKPGPNFNYYKTFTTNGGKSWSKGDGNDAWYAGQAGKPRKSGKIDRKSKAGEKLPENVIMIRDFTIGENSIARKTMTLGFLAKFTQNPLLKKMLLATNDAQLWHIINRKPDPEYWDHLMIVRDCIRKYDNIYDLSKVSQLSSDIINKLLSKSESFDFGFLT
jgi:predicted NAD-dependent protein-ADP-ribosyltransferase YbiA (DUF1768 family)